MARDNSQSFLPIALVLVLLAAGVALYLGTHTQPNEDVARNDAFVEGQRGRQAVEPASVADIEEPVARTGVAGGTAEREAVQVAAAASDAEPTGVLVRLDLDESPWLDRAWYGKVVWQAEGAEESKLFISDTTFLLPSEPSSPEEFQSIVCAGLVAIPYEIAAAVDAPPIEVDGGAPRVPDFVLRARVARGAELVWADTVPFDERSKVDVAFGGSMAPPSRETYSFGSDTGLRGAREGLELPLELPRANEEKLVWVGAAGKEWRSFLVAADSSRVEVQLASAASVRVLHDGPTDPPSYVVTESYPVGDLERVEITSDEPVVVSELDAAPTRVWIEQREDEPISRIERLALSGVVETEVDLRAESALDGRGGLRITLRATAATLALAKSGVKVLVKRRSAPESEFPWEHFADFEPDLGGAPEFIREIVGLVPAVHRVQVDPFGECATVTVEAGVVKEVEIALDGLGFVKFVIPQGYEDARGFATVATVESRVDQRFASFGVGGPDLNATFALARGTYTARTSFFGSDDRPELESAPFVVETGVTTTVTLAPRRTVKLKLAAVDADTGEPIALDLAFWVDVQIYDEETGERVLGTTSFTGSGDSRTGAESDLPHITGAVRVVLPDSKFFDFEGLEPFVPSGEAVVTLRARAK